MIQLNPPIPLFTPKGEGLAHFIIDYGIEHNLYWVVFIDSTGECWTFQNPEVRATKNITEGRINITALSKSDVMAGCASVREYKKKMEFDHAP